MDERRSHSRSSDFQGLGPGESGVAYPGNGMVCCRRPAPVQRLGHGMIGTVEMEFCGEPATSLSLIAT